MEIKVKEVGVVEEKSVNRSRRNSTRKCRTTTRSRINNKRVVDNSTSQEETQSTELKEEDVLSYIKNRYDKDISFS